MEGQNLCPSYQIRLPATTYKMVEDIAYVQIPFRIPYSLLDFIIDLDIHYFDLWHKKKTVLKKNLESEWPKHFLFYFRILLLIINCHYKFLIF